MPRGPRAYLASQLGRPAGLGARLIAPVLNTANRRWIDASCDALAATPGSDVVDLGFGGGLGLNRLLCDLGPNGTVTGVDFSREMVDRASRRHRDELLSARLRLICADFAHMELSDSGYDGAISVNTIYYVDDLVQALADMSRPIKPGGMLVLGVGDPAYMSKRSFAAYVKLRPLNAVIDSACDAGLVVDEHSRTSDDPRAFHILTCRRP